MEKTPDLRIARYGEQIKDPLVIDSRLKFLYFLAGHPYIPGNENNLPYHLNLSDYKTWLVELQQATQEVNVFSEDQQKLVLQPFEGKALRLPAAQQAMDRLRDDLQAKYSEKGAGERSRAIYYDVKADTLEATDITQGGYTSVRNSLYLVHEQGNVPLMEIHTHPEESLPSAQDYWPFLYNLYEDGSEECRAVMVLCPNSQVLVLSTSGTPRLETEVIEKLFQEQERETSFETNPRLASLLRRVTFLMEHGTKHQISEFKSLAELLAAKEKEGELLEQPIEETILLVQRIGDEYQAALDKYWARNVSIGKRANKKMWDEFRQTSNTFLLDFARRMNIVLYRSTNMEDFFRFSA